MTPPDASADYLRYRAALAREPLPTALLDLDALDRNIDLIASAARSSKKTLRVATKSLRCVGLIRHILDRCGPVARGLMTYDAAETAWLASLGFDDLLLAYPTAQPRDAALLADLSASGKQIAVVVDAEEHLAALDRAARPKHTVIEVVLEVDMALRPAGGALHLGVLRSPLRSAAAAVALAEATRRYPGTRLAGVMGYEAQIAGLPDRDPLSPDAVNLAQRALKKLSRRHVASLRSAVSRELLARGFSLRLFNGGGTGSVRWSSGDEALSEVTAGSGFVTSHLFDHYDDLLLSPALFFALQVARRPDPSVVTCAGGGYVASGSAGPGKLPRPWLPAGLRLIDLEGAGEVQTPLRLPRGLSLSIGDPVFFRHAKAGELAERFSVYHAVRGSEIVEKFSTYRGDGRCFV